MMASAHLVAAGRPIRLRYALGWYAGRGLWIVMCALGALSAIAASALLALVASDYRPMVVSTTSMHPTLGTGDVIVSEVVPPSASGRMWSTWNCASWPAWERRQYSQRPCAR